MRICCLYNNFVDILIPSIIILLVPGMGQPSSVSESEYSDGVSDVDMEDASMFRSEPDAISPDDVSDDYSFMSLGSSDDNQSLPNTLRRKHRPKSLNLSRSVSGTSSEDESDSAISTDVESKYAGSVKPPDPHELRIALAASAFVQDMRGVEINMETDEEVADISAKSDHSGSDKVRFSPSAPVSPSWREGLESPPFSPRRRDSYPGKRRGSSPVSPKEKKRFTYTDISPPSRQLSIEDLYDKDAQASNGDPALVPHAQRPSPKSPDEMRDSFYGNDGEMLTFDRPTSSLKKSKPFYSLEDAAMDINDTTTIMDLATYAAAVASNTASLTSMSISPTNLELKSGEATPESRGSASPVSPTYYEDYNNDSHGEDSEGDIELADPSQKSIDYQNSKRQKVRPPTTDWSPVIDLSPILDVSPSLEEAEQAEMLAQQQEERARQASREGDAFPPDNNFIAIGDQLEDVDYEYYGLKRYDVVEDISELVNQQNNSLTNRTTSESETSPKTIVCSNTNANTNLNHDPVNEKTDASASVPSSVRSKTTDVQSCDTEPKVIDSVKTKEIIVSNDVLSKCRTVQEKKDNVKDGTQLSESDNGTQTKSKSRRKLPEPTAEIIATQKPVPKPRRKDKPSDPPPANPPPKPARVAVRTDSKELKEPTRNPPIYSQSATVGKTTATSTKPRPPLQKQTSEERRRTAKEMKAQPDPLIMSHIETEEASSSPPYRVLESPPSPENKAAIRREYSDSTSVSPSSSPDRESFLYPSPVTPPDSDSSPPKPHSPSSGTDFEDEFILVSDAAPYTNNKGEDAALYTSSKRERTSGRSHSLDNGARVRPKDAARNVRSFSDDRGMRHGPESGLEMGGREVANDKVGWKVTNCKFAIDAKNRKEKLTDAINEIRNIRDS